jgi:hypothetical protein
MPRSRSRKIKSRKIKAGQNRGLKIRAEPFVGPPVLPMVSFQPEKIIFPPGLTLPKYKDEYKPIYAQDDSRIRERMGKRPIKRIKMDDYIEGG